MTISLLDQIRYSGIRKPTIQSVRKRAIPGLERINSILKLKNASQEELELAFDITKLLKVYEEVLYKSFIPRFSLHRILISICERSSGTPLYNKVFSELKNMMCIHEPEDPNWCEVRAAYLLLELKSGPCTENYVTEINELINKIEDTKRKSKIANSLSKYIRKNKIKTDKNIQITNWLLAEKSHTKEEFIKTKYYKENDELRHYLKERYFCLSYFSGKERIFKSDNFISKAFIIYWKRERGDGLLSIFKKIVEIKPNSTNITFLDKIQIEFLKGYFYFINKKYKKTKNILKELLLQLNQENKKSIYIEIYFHIYYFLILCHLFLCEYLETNYYLRKSIELADQFLVDELVNYFLNMLFFVQRLGGVCAPYPRNHEKWVFIKQEIITKGTINQLELKNGFVENLYFNLLLKNIAYQIRELRLYNGNINYDIINNPSIDYNITPDPNFFHKRCYKIISFFTINDILYYCDYSENANLYKTKINFKDILIELNEILSKSKDILKSNVNSQKDKINWWIKRIELDNRLEVLIHKVNESINIKCDGYNSVVIILDEITTPFPFELLFKVGVYRIPSFQYLTEIKKWDSKISVKNVFYLLDPEKNLENTRLFIGNFLKEKNIKKGIVGRIPIKNEWEEALNHDLFLYFGHGNGCKYVQDKSYIKQSCGGIKFFFGCSSAKLFCTENFKRDGVVLKYFEEYLSCKNERLPLILGCLWDVTDKDIDRFTVGFLDDLMDNKKMQCVANLVMERRKEFKLKYLNGAAVVVYGLPTFIEWRI
ncbi:Separin [Astathelohania contejeani]|uniref:separase n=1 Tax=Astathelohania contejeani TaxID=164912 RepID=A0ABQ7HY80_9MICR|nr:Separin [Thelohania contejeani]